MATAIGVTNIGPAGHQDSKGCTKTCNLQTYLSSWASGFFVGRTSLEGQPQDHSMMIQDGRDGVKDKLKMGCADFTTTVALTRIYLYLISSFVTTKLWVATPHPLWPWVPAHGPVLKDRHSVAPRRMGQSTPRLCVGSKFFKAVESQRSQLSACR